jgi:hypothetical protein
MEVDNEIYRSKKMCKVEKASPDNEWENSWRHLLLVSNDA